MSEETTIAKLISDEKISTDSTTLDALKCYVRSLPNDERMKERSVIHDFVENIGENKSLAILGRQRLETIVSKLLLEWQMQTLNQDLHQLKNSSNFYMKMILFQGFKYTFSLKIKRIIQQEKQEINQRS